MTTIAILPEEGEADVTAFSAISAGRQATGRTAGEALDALTIQLGVKGSGAVMIMQQVHPDRFFPIDPRDSLSRLMAQWRAVRETRNVLPTTEQTELERLVDEELQGATERSAQILRDLEARKLRYRLNEAMAKLRATMDSEHRRASHLHMATLLATIFGLLLIIVAAALLANGAMISAVVSLIAGAVMHAFDLLLLRREDAAHKRIGSLYAQAEEINRPQFEDFSDVFEPSIGSGQQKELTRAR